METQKTTKAKSHYAWKILVACCLINMSALGLSNSNGLFYPEICSELGFKMSALSVHMIIAGLSSALTLFVVDRVYKKYDTRLILGASLLMFHLSYMAMSLFHSIAEFCIASVFTGISGAFLNYIPVPMLINNWFIKSKKTALSICFVASGLSGILSSMLLGWTITTFGWRVSYVIRGILLLLLIVPVLFIVRKKPEDLGLEPYGKGEEETKKGSTEEKKANGKESGHKVYGVSAERHSFEAKRLKFICAVYLAVSLNLSCGMTGQLPNFASSIGLSVMMGSVLTSLAMAGNISSKMVFGPLTEKMGVTKVTAATIAVMAAGWLVTGLGCTGMTAVYITAFTTGISACVNTLVIPNLADTFVQGDEYVHVLARCSTGTMIASAFNMTISSALFDLFGSYQPVFLVYAALQAVNIAVLIAVFGKKRK